MGARTRATAVALFTALCAAMIAGRGTSAHGPVVATNADARPAPGAKSPAAVPGSGRVTVAVRAADPRRVPASFLGLSTESWELPHYSRYSAAMSRVIGLVRTGPARAFMLRIGGDSADLSRWTPSGQATPPWAYALTPRWLTQTRRLVARTGARVILDLNIADRDPVIEARWARLFTDAMPAGSVAGLEIGNEPDLFTRDSHHARLATAPQAAVHRYFQAVRNYSSRDYAAAFAHYAQAIQRLLPGMPLLGPSLGSPNVSWLRPLLARDLHRLNTVTVHRYPLNACVTDRASDLFPTVKRLLSASSSQGLAASVQPALAAAHKHGVPLRLDEFNDVTCGGRRGVNGTFADALWTSDTLFELLKAGVDGVNLHMRATPLNAPFYVTARGLLARPELYGLALFKRTLGPGAQLEHARITAPPGANLTVWPVRVDGGRLHVLMLNKGAHAEQVTLRAGGRGPASLQRLLAPSPSAPGPITLAGARIGTDARWHGHRSVAPVADTHGSYRVPVPAYSAALLEFPVRDR